jgi:hypothetical protein
VRNTGAPETRQTKIQSLRSCLRYEYQPFIGAMNAAIGFS